MFSKRWVASSWRTGARQNGPLEVSGRRVLSNSVGIPGASTRLAHERRLIFTDERSAIDRYMRVIRVRKEAVGFSPCGPGRLGPVAPLRRCLWHEFQKQICVNGSRYVSRDGALLSRSRARSGMGPGTHMDLWASEGRPRSSPVDARLRGCVSEHGTSTPSGRPVTSGS